MANYFLCLVLQRLLLPILIATTFLRRPVGISIPYFLLFLYLPLVPVATSKTLRGRTGNFLKLLIVTTLLVILCQVAFQITVVSLESDFIPKCGLVDIILRHVGLVKLVDLPVLEIIDWISPEILMLVTSIGFFFLLRSLAVRHSRALENDAEALLQPPKKKQIWTEDKYTFLTGLGVFLSMFSILVAASMRPSIEGGVYFLVYIAAGTYWACYRSLGRGFAFILRILMVFIILHIFTLLSYQTPILQEMFAPNSTIPRYFGLTDIYHSSCTDDSDNRYVYFNNTFEIDTYLNPIAILVCYYVLAFTSSVQFSMVEIKKTGGFGQLDNSSRLSRQVSTQLKKRAADKWRLSANKLKHRLKNKTATSNEPNERTPLMRKGTKRLRDVTAEDTASGEMPMKSLDKEVPSTEAKQETHFVDQIVLGIETIASIIYKNSYIFTNICMMAWSIMYHSWLTFVFLIWANILWVIPNQRKAMLQSSPFIVLYAIFLLLAQYAYSMNLTEDELPTKIKNENINLAQIGFVRYAHYPIQHILLKSAFTVMFWITLRQLIQENKLKKQKSTLADMVAPLQVTVGTAAGRMGDDKPQKSEFMKKMGDLFNSLLLKTWIWIVMLTVFTSGIAGTKMTGFRIIYMALFLIFILMFQISWRAWKTFMYGFWLILIAYAMLILILVYTYQFDRFPEYWEIYLKIPTQLQKDIGLDVFKTKELFLNLLTPTLVVVMTVIQLHYFHKNYIKMLEIPLRNDSLGSANTNPSENYGNIGNTDEIISDPISDDANQQSKPFFHAFKFRKLSFKELKQHVIELGRAIMEFTEILWIYSELHLIKLILFAGFLIGISDVSLLHIVFVVLSVVGTAFHTTVQILISRVISFIVATLFITKMIYQVDYIKHTDYDVVCNNQTNPNDINNADWFGLHMANDGLLKLLYVYIYYLLIVTLHSVVQFRQHHKRASQNQPYTTPSKIFPKINRINSEKNLSNMIKFLVNFGFYKFGLEICLILLVSLIGSRLDLIACIYTFWLVIIFAIDRRNASQIWLIFMLFIMICIIIQYIVMVGVPPGFCVEYPWKTQFLENLQKWAMLPDDKLYTQVKKLVLDFILLIAVSRQAVVFRIERRYAANVDVFPGGSNRDITEEISKHGFSLIKNPTPDFTTYVRNWLDIVKRAVLLGLFWFSLAIVFLTGTNRVNLFSLGYLLSSFIFLWQGSDLYLRPIRTIIKWWKIILSYNIFVIIIKTFLQIAGCLFFNDLAENACWLIQVLGITCINKFEKKSINDSCAVPDEEVGLFWDGICFACLLFQLRTFRSYYFCHIVNDTKASNILASRGAQLIEDFQAKQLKIQNAQENEILDKIKMKMDRIKATQEKLERHITDPKIHAQDDGGEGCGISAPLARSTSMSSCAGYHTPIEDEMVTSVIVEHFGSDVPSYIEPLSTSRGNGGGISGSGGSYLQTQVLSPSSALMTVSLEGYLDPQRLSFGSPSGSDLLPRIPSLDDTFPVFSPPPFDQKIQKSPKQIKHCSPEKQQDSNTSESATQSNTLVPSVMDDNAIQTTANLQVQRHRRQSSLNTVSWPDQNMADGAQKRRYSSTLNPTYSTTDEQSPVYRPRIHQRHASIGASVRESRRRSSYTFNTNDEASSARTTYHRQSSWGGPNGEMYHRQSIISISSRSPNSHHESIRSGDYYMFDDLDVKIDLEILTEQHDDEEIVEDASTIRLKNRLTVGKLIQQKIQELKESSESKEDQKMKRQSSLIPTSERAVDARTTISEPIMRDSQSEAPQISSESTQVDSQQPSTSKGPPITPKRQESLDAGSLDGEERTAILKWLLLIWKFIESLMVSLTIRLNRVSRNYRYVVRVLSKEKKTLKLSEGFGMGLKISSALIWGQAPASEQTATELVDTAATSSISSGSITLEVVDSPKKSSGDYERTSKEFSEKGYPAQIVEKPKETTERRTSMVPEIRILAPSLERGLDETSDSKIRGSFDMIKDSDKMEDSEDFSRKDHSVIVDLLASFWFAILSHTDFLCYLMVFLNQIQSASMLSLPLPLMVFFWGTLTVPRPSKTFWITLIAYTQTVVLLKCASQFEILWWNGQPIPENQPLAPARIFGIEKKKGYATYDLALLLVVFFHRFMLKSMGLWKSELRDETLKDGVYSVQKNEGFDGENNGKPIVQLQSGEEFFENFIDTLFERGMSVEEVLQTEKEYLRILRKSRRRSDLITLQELLFILSLEIQDIIVNGRFRQMFYNGQIVNVVNMDNNELQLTRVEPGGRVEFVDEKDDKVQVSNLIEETSNYFPGIVKLSFTKHTSSLRQFFEDLLGPASRATRDVYLYMILCDFINFLVLLFGFTSFGASQGDGGVSAYLQENKIPVAFLVMLILQFVLIIIDRALYLRKYLLGKIIFQYILIIVIHVWMFFVIPAVTERSFNVKLAPVIWYLNKCIYLLFSAFQIRCGYPKRSIGNFLTKGFGIINFISHKVFLLIPFLFELRTLMDWIWTDTTMTLFDWLKMEDIFVAVYQIKCGRQLETDFPKPRGIRTPTLIKYVMGGGLLFVLIAIIWFPLALFAFGNTVGKDNPPYDVTVSLRIGPYEPVYTMSAQDSNILQFNEPAYNKLLKQFARDKVALTFLTNYDPGDITAVILSANSTSLWNISPPDKTRLREDVDSNNTLTIRFKYSVSRPMNVKDKSELVIAEQHFELGIGDPRRLILSEMLGHLPRSDLLILPKLFPKFLKVKNSGDLNPVSLLFGPEYFEDEKNAFRDISLTLFQTETAGAEQMWWETKELCNDTIYTSILKNLPYEDCTDTVVMYLFNDKIFPSQISSLAANGILGLYVTIVIVVSRVIRGFVAGMYTKIMFEDLPNVDRVLQLCLDIYLVREALEFRLEEDLFAKLIFLYRSPETMIKWTRPMEEESDVENDGGNNDDDDDDVPPLERRSPQTDFQLRQRKPMVE